MKNIYLIPTEKASILIQKRITKELKLSSLNNPQRWSNVNIYITSDEKLKKGDESLLIVDGFEPIMLTHHEPVKDGYLGKKIILTTDTELIADGVQAIDDEFLEWLVKNPSCEFVEVNKLCYGALSGFADAGYKIIIPQEEPKQEIIATEEDAKIFVDTIENPLAPNEKLKNAFGKQPKQETLEEAAKKYLNSGKVPNDYQSFIAGAKWQAERRYSEEEVIKSFDNLGFKQITSEELNSLPYQPFITDEDSNIWVIDKEQWFEQFKKNKL